MHSDFGSRERGGARDSAFVPNPYGPAGGRPDRQSGGQSGGRLGAGAPGSFAGRGPRGYRRSDDRIRDEACERLTDHPLIDASDVDVEVRDGVVTLTGRVAIRAEKHLAEDVIDEVAGVRDVENRLRVQPSPAPLFGGQQRPPGAEDWEGRPARVGRDQVRRGMVVVDRDGDEIGQVKERYERDFLLNRPRIRDVYVPYAAIRGTSEDRVTLVLDGRDVDAQGWHYPELLGIRNAGYSIP